MAKAKSKNKQTELSFEQAVNELKEIVSKIENGDVPLQDSITQYEKGMELIQHCRTILQQAEKRIEKISQDQISERDSKEKVEE